MRKTRETSKTTIYSITAEPNGRGVLRFYVFWRKRGFWGLLAGWDCYGDSCGVDGIYSFTPRPFPSKEAAQKYVARRVKKDDAYYHARLALAKQEEQ